MIEEEIKVVTKQYRSADGLIFTTKKDCKDHEENLMAENSLQLFNAAVNVHTSGSYIAPLRGPSDEEWRWGLVHLTEQTWEIMKPLAKMVTQNYGRLYIDLSDHIGENVAVCFGIAYSQPIFYHVCTYEMLLNSINNYFQIEEE